MGPGWAFTTLGLFCAACTPLVWAEYRFGQGWRAKRKERERERGDGEVREGHGVKKRGRGASVGSRMEEEGGGVGAFVRRIYERGVQFFD